MMKRTVTAMLAALLIAAVPGVAFAQEAPERPAQEREVDRAEQEARWIGQVKARALEAIKKRLVTIDELQAAIDRSETVKANHAAQLTNELRKATSGLESLLEEIEAATDLETLRVLVPKIFEDYRIYAIVAPKVHLVLAADHAVAVADRMGTAAEALGDVLDRFADAGYDVGEGEALLAEMERLLESGADQTGSVPDMVIDLAPADYPESSEVLRNAQSVLKSGAEDLRAAGQTAHEVVRFIKSLIGDGDN